ncbi:DUF3923 family protein [Solibacillus sp. FSL W7-1324]|uniref:DUF3923 family protein n=1 Tax=Solibacillus sp. FSL W7-1324 TaxID=2921701 RepID=UPI0030F89DF4
MKLWWLTSFLWLIFFSIVALIIGFRKVDGSGLEQTSELRIVAFIILGVIFIFVLLCQLVFLYFALKRKSNSTYGR